MTYSSIVSLELRYRAWWPSVRLSTSEKWLVPRSALQHRRLSKTLSSLPRMRSRRSEMMHHRARTNFSITITLQNVMCMPVVIGKQQVRNALDSLLEVEELILLNINTQTREGIASPRIWFGSSARPPQLDDRTANYLRTQILHSDLGPMHGQSLITSFYLVPVCR